MVGQQQRIVLVYGCLDVCAAQICEQIQGAGEKRRHGTILHFLVVFPLC